MRAEDPGPLPAGAAKEDLKMRFGQVLENGLQALRQGLLIDPQYDDAMAYVNLLIRERADLRDTSAEYQRDVAEADQWVDRALETKRKKAEQRAGNLPVPNQISVTQSLVTSAVVPPSPPPPPPPPPPAYSGSPQSTPATPARIRVGGNVQAAMIIRKVVPVYPTEAKSAGIQGVVQLGVILAEDGTVAEITVLDGPDALAQAAIDAVRQWVYRPTLLNGRPVQVETTVSVNFTLNQ
jgi:TonB family protein